MFRYGFFNAVDGDRVYNADDLSQFYYGLISDGVLAAPTTSLQVTASTGMSVSAASGRAMIRCKYFINTADCVLTAETADDTDPRIDRIVLRMDAQNRNFDILCRKGTAAASPSAPALIRNGSVFEISLAQIRIPPGATEITQEMILDERGDTNVCGLCHFNAPEDYAVDAGQNAIITNMQRDILAGGGERMVVEIRCHSIEDVTPALESWGTGSIAWEIPTGKFYALDTDGTWAEVQS